MRRIGEPIDRCTGEDIADVRVDESSGVVARRCEHALGQGGSLVAELVFASMRSAHLRDRDVRSNSGTALEQIFDSYPTPTAIHAAHVGEDIRQCRAPVESPIFDERRHGERREHFRARADVPGVRFGDRRVRTDLGDALGCERHDTREINNCRACSDRPDVTAKLRQPLL